MRTAVLAATAWAALAGSAGADEVHERDANGRSGAHVLVRVGQARAPFYTPALSETEAEFTQARMVIIGGHLAASARLSVGARLPFALSTIRLPGGSYFDDKALGNPELFAERGSLGFAIGRLTVRAAVRAAAGLPIAEHGGSLVENRALALADALDGWRSPELFGAGLLPVTVSGRLGLAAASMRVDVLAKLPVAVRIHDAGLPDQARTRSFGMTPHLELRGTFWPWPWLGAGAGVYGVAQLPAVVTPPADSTRTGSLLLGLEPRIVLALSSVTLTADLALPLAGPLDGTIAAGFTVALHR